MALTAAARAEGSLPEKPLPAGHPCTLEDARFSPLHEERGISVAALRLPDGRVVVRTRAALEATGARVSGILEDVARWPSFIARLRSLAPLPGEPPAFAAVLGAPWPLHDRAYAFAPAAARSAAARVVFWEDASERLPPGAAANGVRVAPVTGCFSVSLSPADGTALLSYTELDVFGESLPAWLRGAARRKGPVRLVDSLRARLREN